jgi:hypothetical protein
MLFRARARSLLMLRDSVFMLANIEPPTEKDKQTGKEVPVPESSGKYKKWLELKQKRKELLENLRRPVVGLTISTKKSGKRMFVLITASEKRLYAEAQRIEYQVKMKVSD